MDSESSHPQALETLKELIENVSVFLLVTTLPNGSLRGIPVAHARQPFEGSLWIFADPAGLPLVGVALPCPVFLGSTAVEDCRYLSLSGQLEHIPDANLARQLWQPSYQEWLPSGLPDPVHGLFRMTVQHAEYWDAAHSVMRQMGGLMRGMFTGHRPAVGDHESLDLAPDGSPL